MAKEEAILYRWHRGPRDYQEDSLNFARIGKRVLFVVADGMGGHSRGDMASNIAVNTFLEAFQKGTMYSPSQILEAALRKTFERIKEKGIDMGTTLVAGILEPEASGKYLLTYTWVGDSRLYVYTPRRHNPRKDNPSGAVSLPEDEPEEKRKLWLLTRDHSLVWGLFASGEITLDQITTHPAKNQLQHSIHSSHPNFPVIINEAVLYEGDKIFLCTDGVWESFTSHRLMAQAFENPYLSINKQVLDRIIDSAIKTGQCDDNNTYVLAQASKRLFKTTIAPLHSKKPPKVRVNKLRLMQISSLVLFLAALLALAWFILLRKPAHKITIGKQFLQRLAAEKAIQVKEKDWKKKYCKEGKCTIPAKSLMYYNRKSIAELWKEEALERGNFCILKAGYSLTEGEKLIFHLKKGKNKLYLLKSPKVEARIGEKSYSPFQCKDLRDKLKEKALTHGLEEITARIQPSPPPTPSSQKETLPGTKEKARGAKRGKEHPTKTTPSHSSLPPFAPQPEVPQTVKIGPCEAKEEGAAGELGKISIRFNTGGVVFTNFYDLTINGKRGKIKKGQFNLICPVKTLQIKITQKQKPEASNLKLKIEQLPQGYCVKFGKEILKPAAEYQIEFAAKSDTVSEKDHKVKTKGTTLTLSITTSCPKTSPQSEEDKIKQVEKKNEEIKRLRKKGKKLKELQTEISKDQKDPWGNPYIFEYSGPHWLFCSLGKDRTQDRATDKIIRLPQELKRCDQIPRLPNRKACKEKVKQKARSYRPKDDICFLDGKRLPWKK